MTRRIRGEAAVFAAATALALVQALDDAFVHRGPGLGVSQHAAMCRIALPPAWSACWFSRRCDPGSGPGSRSRMAAWRSSTA